MPNILDEFAGGVTGLFIGSPGVGKSVLLGSVGELTSNVLLLAPKPNEVNSYMYRKHGIDKTAEIYKDHKWKPSLGIFEADGFLRLSRRILELYDDTTYEAVLVDPLTDVVQLAAHDLMKAEKVETPRDLKDAIGFYGSLKYKLKDFVQTLVGLASPDLPQPKHVFCSVHAQPTKEEDIKGKETADAKGKGVEFYGDSLPMIEGGYRREIAAEFDIVGYNSVQHTVGRDNGKMVRQVEYVVQLTPDNERHAKVRLSPALTEKTFPNNLKAILEAVHKSST